MSRGSSRRRYTLFGGVEIDAQRLLTLGVSVILLILLWVFIYRTRMGKAILAVAQDREAALFMGINSERVYLTVIAISAMLAAIGGAFIAPTQGARPEMWSPPLGPGFRRGGAGGDGKPGRDHFGGSSDRLYGSNHFFRHLQLFRGTRGRDHHSADAYLPPIRIIRETH